MIKESSAHRMKGVLTQISGRWIEYGGYFLLSALNLPIFTTDESRLAYVIRERVSGELSKETYRERTDIRAKSRPCRSLASRSTLIPLVERVSLVPKKWTTTRHRIYTDREIAERQTGGQIGK